MKATYTYIDKYIIKAKTVSPIHVGSGEAKDSILVHPDTHLPFIQATSICGVFRAYCRQIDSKLERALYGDSIDDTESRLKFTDINFRRDGNLRLEVRPHVRIDKHTGTTQTNIIEGVGKTSGQKFESHYIGSGAECELSIYAYDLEDSERAMIEDSILALHHGEMKIGGEKTNGCGEVEIISLMHGKYDMTQKSSRLSWIREDGSGLVDETSLLDSPYKSLTNSFDIVVKMRPVDEILIKGTAVSGYGKEASKAENIKDASYRYIVPGSALKGIIRNRMEMIASYIGIDDSFIENYFGKSKDSRSDGKAGQVYFHDIIFSNVNEKKHPRIRIDKFTGGVIDGALFTELAISGDMEMKVSIKKTEGDRALVALMLLALRDLWAKRYSIGSGQSIGRGYVDIESIRIVNHIDGSIIDIGRDFSMTQDSESMAQDLLSALDKRR